jgi:glycosyltransferase involved in cell wall biosynthesis
MKSIVIITHGYPCKARPIWLAFVREIAHAFARTGLKVTVIFPHAVHRAMRAGDPFHWKEDAGNGAVVDVYCPRFLSFSSLQLGGWNTERLTLFGCYRAARRVLLKHMPEKPDALYGHFLYLGGAVAARLGRECGIPAFVAVGEGNLCSMEPHGAVRAGKDLGGVAAYIPNSSELSRQLQSELQVPREKIGVFPNGIDRRVFWARDRVAMRRKYGLPADTFLVCCVGYFTENKGPVRVGEAICGLSGVGGVFVGAGPVPPAADNIVFKSALTHDQVPEVMSACDVFVLPTKYEGCCSAILEAMSCGLPIVSSEGAFNDDILNNHVSIRISPTDINAIRQAIVYLKGDREKCSIMAGEAQKWAINFDIDLRMKRLRQFMCEQCFAYQIMEPRK